MQEPVAMAPLSQILIATAFPVGMAVLGAVLAATRPIGAVGRSAVQHFAAGVVFFVVAGELLPGVTLVHDPLEIGLAFALGLALMFAVEWLSEHRGAMPGAGQLVGIGIDALIDGLLVGIAFAAGEHQGLLLTGALAMELLTLGMAMGGSLAAAGAGRIRTILVPTGVASLLFVGAMIGGTLLRDASPHTLAGVLAFGCAALLYLVTEELLVQAHEKGDTRFATSMFFGGFLLFLLLSMLELRTPS